jgi:hypothetical protein
MLFLFKMLTYVYMTTFSSKVTNEVSLESFLSQNGSLMYSNVFKCHTYQFMRLFFFKKNNN